MAEAISSDSVKMPVNQEFFTGSRAIFFIFYITKSQKLATVSAYCWAFRGRLSAFLYVFTLDLPITSFSKLEIK
jgi:hypothetical protein